MIVENKEQVYAEARRLSERLVVLANRLQGMVYEHRYNDATATLSVIRYLQKELDMYIAFLYVGS
jgi:hypothetical protein